MTSLPDHGGGLSAAAKQWPAFRGEWLDLSTGINPWSYPIPPFPQDIWTRLPDKNLDDALCEAAAAHYGAKGPTQILITPGSGAIIRALPLTRPPSRVAVLGPTYSEHASSWSAAGHTTRLVTSLTEAENADVVVVVNPNNPDGRTLSPGVLTEFANTHPSCLLVVDQAFADVDPILSIIPNRPDNCFVLASFGKFFGLAGLRLGLAFGSSEVLAPISARLGPWPVSGPALFVGACALKDERWSDETRRNLSEQAHKLDETLLAAGLDIIGGTALFRLIRNSDAHTLWNDLGRTGILTRAFAYDTTWLRIGLPPDAKALKRLADSLTNRSK